MSSGGQQRRRSQQPAGGRLRLLLLLLVPEAAWPFSFTVPAGKRECYHEIAQMSERIAGEWRVLNVDVVALDLDVQVCLPTPARTVKANQWYACR